MSILKLAHNLGAKIKVAFPYIHNLISCQREIVEIYCFYHVLCDYSQLITCYLIVELILFYVRQPPSKFKFPLQVLLNFNKLHF